MSSVLPSLEKLADSLSSCYYSFFLSSTASISAFQPLERFLWSVILTSLSVVKLFASIVVTSNSFLVSFCYYECFLVYCLSVFSMSTLMSKGSVSPSSSATTNYLCLLLSWISGNILGLFELSFWLDKNGYFSFSASLV